MKQLSFRSLDMTIDSLFNLELKGKIITNPDYQRDFVYTTDKSSRLIESALMLIPLPTIYLCEETNGTFSVVDGQQRIMSFLKFMKGEYPLMGLTSLPEYNGKYYKELDVEVQTIIDQTAIRTIMIGKESADAKFDIFERLNRGAVTLKEQEIRNCVFRGPFNDMINELAKEAIVQDMFIIENKRMTFQEHILRFFSLKDFTNYTPSMKTYMNKYMAIHQYDDEKSIHKYKEQFLGTLSIIKQVLGKNAFYSVDYDKKEVLNKLSSTFYDSLMVPFSMFDRTKIIANADAIREKINLTKLYNDDYHMDCYAATGSRDRVISRILTILNSLNDILGSDGLNKEKRTFDPNLKGTLAETQNYICPLCNNKIIDLDSCEIDHITPYSLGGLTKEYNAQLVHKTCNRIKNNNVVNFEIKDASEKVDNEFINKESFSFTLSKTCDLTGKRVLSFTFDNKIYHVNSMRELFICFLKVLNNKYNKLFKKLADEKFTLSAKTKPYITYNPDDFVIPYEVTSGIFVETCFNNNRVIKVTKALLYAAGENPSSLEIKYTNK